MKLRAEVGSQRSEVRGQSLPAVSLEGSDIRSRMSEVRGQMSEIRCQMSEIKCRMSDIRGQMSDVGDRRSDGIKELTLNIE